MMDCIIVDDDVLIRMEVQQMVKKIPYLHLVGTSLSSTDAFQLITFYQPDLVFLDVMLPEVNGIELMQSFQQHMPQIILMSVNKNFAVEAVKYNVTDFLAKPFSEKRFRQAVEKARQLYEIKQKPSV